MQRSSRSEQEKIEVDGVGVHVPRQTLSREKRCKKVGEE